MKFHYKVGDRVKCIRDNIGQDYGKIGTVIKLRDNGGLNYKVHFDTDLDDEVNVYFRPDEIQLLEEGSK